MSGDGIVREVLRNQSGAEILIVQGLIDVIEKLVAEQHRTNDMIERQYHIWNERDDARDKATAEHYAFIQRDTDYLREREEVRWKRLDEMDVIALENHKKGSAVLDLQLDRELWDKKIRDGWKDKGLGT